MSSCAPLRLLAALVVALATAAGATSIDPLGPPGHAPPTITIGSARPDVDDFATFVAEATWLHASQGADGEALAADGVLCGSWLETIDSDDLSNIADPAIYVKRAALDPAMLSCMNTLGWRVLMSQ